MMREMYDKNLRISPWKGLLIIFLFAFLAAIIVSVQSKTGNVSGVPDLPHVTPVVASVPEATLLIDPGDSGSKRMFKGEILDGMTVLHVLKFASKYAERGKLEFELVGPAGQRYIQSLNGIANVPGGKSWKLYLNGEIQSDSPDTLTVKEGDRIEFKYQ